MFEGGRECKITWTKNDMEERGKRKRKKQKKKDSHVNCIDFFVLDVSLLDQWARKSSILISGSFTLPIRTKTTRQLHTSSSGCNSGEGKREVLIVLRGGNRLVRQDSQRCQGWWLQTWQDLVDWLLLVFWFFFFKKHFSSSLSVRQ